MATTRKKKKTTIPPEDYWLIQQKMVIGVLSRRCRALEAYLKKAEAWRPKTRKRDYEDFLAFLKADLGACREEVRKIGIKAFMDQW